KAPAFLQIRLLTGRGNTHPARALAIIHGRLADVPINIVQGIVRPEDLRHDLGDETGGGAFLPTAHCCSHLTTVALSTTRPASMEA
ncbi:hypothetical protein, partial [Nitrospirillum viridazoti]|uniref:hypothetical protein n=1 Tax=Nitrospirillum viridazoti TaxID=3144925 RepID=UPI001B3BEF1B